MADVDVSSLNKGISDLNKNLSRLLGANLFSNSRMNDMVEASNKMRDNFEEISEFTNDIIKSAKEEETKLKAVNALERKRLEIRKLERDIEDRTNKIKKNGLELAERSKDIIYRLKKDEREKTEELKKQTLLYADQRKELQLQLSEAQANLKTSEEQTKEFEKQLAVQKKQRSLLSSLGRDSKKLLGNLKNLAFGTIGKFLSAGMFAEGVKNLYDMSNKVYDSYWKLSVPLQKANTGIGALKDKTEEYSKSLRGVKLTAAKFGYDIDKIEPMISSLQDKVKYLRKDSKGLWEWDIQGLADDAKQIIAISKRMNMESDEMVTLLEERVRRFGDTNESAINSMNEMAAATLTFNEIMGQGSVFTEEVGKHLLELHQNTKYWVQDFGMLNTMFNSHVNLLLKQGKHQKEALAIARQFQEGLQQPPDLIKWKAGTKLLGDIRKEIKGINDEQAAEKIAKKYGLYTGEVDENGNRVLDVGRGKTLVNAIRNSKNTGFTIANILQEELGGTRLGLESTMGAWQSFMGFDSTVLKDMGLANSVSEAEKIKQLYKDIAKNPEAFASDNIEKAIDALVDADTKLSEQAKKDRKNELKKLFGENKGVAGVEPESSFENVVLKTMKSLKAWLDTPMVQIAGGALAGGASIFKDTISTAFGMLLSTAFMKKGGNLIKSAGRGIKNLSGKTLDILRSTPGENFRSIKGRWEANRAYKNMLKWEAAHPEFFPEGKSGFVGDKTVKRGLLRRGASAGLGAAKKTAGFGMRQAGKLGRFAGSTGGWATMALGLGASFLTNPEDKREGLTVNNGAQIVSGIGELVSKFNPYSLGITTLIAAVKGGFDKNAGVLGGVADSLLAPLDSITEGTAKLVGKTSTLGKIMSYMNEGIQSSRRWWTNSKSPEQLQKETEERKKKYANFNKDIRANQESQYDDRYKKVVKKYGLDADVNSKNVEVLIDKLKNDSSWLADLEERGLDTSVLDKLADELNKVRQEQLAKQATADVIDFQKIFQMNGKDAAAEVQRFAGLSEKKYGGKRGEFAGLENYAKEKNWSDEQLRGVRSQARNLAKSMKGINENDAMLKAEDYILGRLEEEELANKAQLDEMKRQKEIQERMARSTQSLVEDSVKQTDYLSVISQKAALDIIKDKDTYTKIFDEHYKTTTNGKVTASGDSWNISGIPTAMAGSMKAVFSM